MGGRRVRQVAHRRSVGEGSGVRRDAHRGVPDTLLEESARFWSTILSAYFNFSRREKDAELLRDMNKDDVLKVFKTFLDPASNARSKLAEPFLAEA